MRTIVCICRFAKCQILCVGDTVLSQCYRGQVRQRCKVRGGMGINNKNIFLRKVLPPPPPFTIWWKKHKLYFLDSGSSVGDFCEKIFFPCEKLKILRYCQKSERKSLTGSRGGGGVINVNPRPPFNGHFPLLSFVSGNHTAVFRLERKMSE